MGSATPHSYSSKTITFPSKLQCIKSQSGRMICQLLRQSNYCLEAPSYQLFLRSIYLPISILSSAHHSLITPLQRTLIHILSISAISKMPHKKSEALTALYNAKIQKLEEEKALADKMNDILTRRGGLNDGSKASRKNLKAAIAVANQPGYFEYYVPSQEIKDVEESKVLNSLVKSLEKVHRELNQINDDISHHHVPRDGLMGQAPQTPEAGLTSLSHWFDTYGRPKNETLLDEMKTTFQSSPKIYGGTNHHRSFKSQSSPMKVGRVTK